ncbi:MAG: PAS domain S-box protein, partial [Candidatus Angelobacter sp.]
MDNLILAMWLPQKISEGATVIPRNAISLFHCPVCSGMTVQFAVESVSSLLRNSHLEQLVAERTSELRENEARFRFLFEQAAVGVAQIDIATGRFVRVNQKYADIVGYTPEEMLALNFHSFAHPADLHTGHVNMNRLKAEEIREFELENR